MELKVGDILRLKNDKRQWYHVTDLSPNDIMLTDQNGRSSFFDQDSVNDLFEMTPNIKNKLFIGTKVKIIRNGDEAITVISKKYSENRFGYNFLIIQDEVIDTEYYFYVDETKHTIIDNEEFNKVFLKNIKYFVKDNIVFKVLNIDTNNIYIEKCDDKTSRTMPIFAFSFDKIVNDYDPSIAELKPGDHIIHDKMIYRVIEVKEGLIKCFIINTTYERYFNFYDSFKKINPIDVNDIVEYQGKKGKVVTIYKTNYGVDFQDETIGESDLGILENETGLWLNNEDLIVITKSTADYKQIDKDGTNRIQKSFNIKDQSLSSSEQLIKKYIQNNCKFYYDIVPKNTILYSGVYNFDYLKNLAVIKKPPQNRISKKTSPELTQKINDIIADRGGIANRSNSVFVTTDIEEAKQYGPVCVVFPIGKFNYTWSSLFKNLGLDQKKSILKNIDDPEIYRKIKNSFHCDIGIKEALQSKHEICINAQKFLMISIENISVETLINK